MDTATEALIAAPVTVPTAGINLMILPTAPLPKPTTTSSLDKLFPTLADQIDQTICVIATSL